MAARVTELLRLVKLDRSRQPLPRPDLRRTAPARRARPRARRRSEGAAARRAVRRARRQCPARPAALAARDPRGARHHHAVRHPRPGGGARPRRPGRHPQRGQDRAAGHARRGLPQSELRLRDEFSGRRQPARRDCRRTAGPSLAEPSWKPQASPTARPSVYLRPRDLDWSAAGPGIAATVTRVIDRPDGRRILAGPPATR